MGELLNQEKEEERYLGKEKIKILTNRFVKKTMKEIFPNTWTRSWILLIRTLRGKQNARYALFYGK